MAKITEKCLRPLFEFSTSSSSKFHLPSIFQHIDQIFEKESTESVCPKCDSSSFLCIKTQKYQNTTYIRGPPSHISLPGEKNVVIQFESFNMIYVFSLK